MAERSVLGSIILAIVLGTAFAAIIVFHGLSLAGFTSQLNSSEISPAQPTEPSKPQTSMPAQESSRTIKAFANTIIEAARLPERPISPMFQPSQQNPLQILGVNLIPFIIGLIIASPILIWLRRRTK